MILHQGCVLKNRYKIEDTLGEGGFGKVFKVRDLQFQQRFVAIKQRIPIDPDDHREKELFEKEAHFLCMLRHPGIPEIFDYFSEQGCQFIVMQFIEGKSLDRLLRENSGVLREADAVPLMIEMINILSYLHSQSSPVVHRDIKPENIVKSLDGLIYLVDFGTSRQFNTARAKDTIRIGTCGYMAPEQFRGHSTPLSDIFSFGAAFHHLLSGIDPRDKKESERYSFPRLRSINTTVSPELEDLIDRCLKEKAEERTGSAEEMVKMLQEISQRHKGQAGQSRESIDPQFWFHQGRFHIDRRDYEKARECFVKSRKFGNNTEEVVVLIARCHRKCGNIERALGILSNLVESGSAGEESVAEYLKVTGSKENTEKVFHHYITLHPDWAVIRALWIEHLIKMRRTGEARLHVEESLQKNPEDIRLIQLKAAILFGEKKVEEAQAYLDKIPEPFCEHCDILFRRGYARELQGNDEEAFSFYRLATKDREHSEALLQMARILAKRGAFFEAREHFEKAAGCSDKPFAIKRELALILSKSGFYEQAVPLLREVLIYSPDDRETLKHMGCVLGELKEYDEALSYLIRYSLHAPEDSGILLIIARYCLIADRLNEAGGFIEKYLSILPGDTKGIELQRLLYGKKSGSAR
ncbi:MAG: protein kinase [Candidatus Xenobiia bacterium LiM19]